MDQASVLAITGQAPTYKIGTAYKQYVNQQQLVQAVTGYSQFILHPDAVPEALTQAMSISLGCKTAAHLSIPSDVWTIAISNPVSGQDTFQQALNLILSSKRPMMLVGSGAQPEGAAIQQLADWAKAEILIRAIYSSSPTSYWL